MRVRLALLEILLLAASASCQQPTEGQRQPRAVPSARSELRAALAPRAASRFRESGGKFYQAHPRLPDTGEWRCAERERVVWCAGGEAAAGVVSGPPDPGYRCGARWGSAAGERVCIDEHPDYPGENYACAFEQERGIARVCRASEPWRGPTLAQGALPACWLDRDCPAGRCDRGTCACNTNQDCALGRCSSGVCSQVKP